jgi:hypothetical protein
MPYEAILEAEKRRSVKHAKKIVSDMIVESKIRRVPVAWMLSSAEEEALEARGEMAAMGLWSHCHVLNFEERDACFHVNG